MFRISQTGSPVLDFELSGLAGYSNRKIFSFSGILKYNQINQMLYNVIWKVFVISIYTFYCFTLYHLFQLFK